MREGLLEEGVCSTVSKYLLSSYYVLGNISEQNQGNNSLFQSWILTGGGDSRMSTDGYILYQMETHGRKTQLWHY
jgi:hypothetical protein